MVKEEKENIKLKHLWQFLAGGSLVVWFLMFLLFPAEAKIFWTTIFVLFKDYWWIVLPFPMWEIYQSMWMEQVVGAWLSSREYTLLELIPPRDIEKSPKLMEHVFAGINDYSTPNRLEIHCGWRVLQPRWSFELTGDEGMVRYFIRCPKASKATAEAQVYAHYPDIIIKEVEDYVKKAPHNIPNARWDVWGATLTLVKPDPVPIRTYRQFQEEVTGKMIDPLANIVEVMGALPKGQHLWFQILLESEKPPNWHPASLAYIQSLIDEHLGKKNGKEFPLLRFWHELKLLPGNLLSALAGKELATPPSSGGEEEPEFNINKLPPGVQEKIEAISQNISKPGFRTVIRFIYFGTRDNFNKALGVAGIMGPIKQLGDVNLNDLVPSNLTKTFANYYFDEERLLRKKRKIYNDFISRDMVGLWMIMNTEELATLYHFPDMSIRSQAITRVESRREEAPANLPVDLEIEE